MSSLIRDIKERVSIPGLVLVVLFISVIWGNSLVAGEGSGSLSAGVMVWVQGLLRSLGLPFAWVTNFRVTDVLIDCSGAFIATFIRSAAVRWYRRREYGRSA